jgi:predicted RNase H-like nuclease (RuvC/YqgF family)
MFNYHHHYLLNKGFLQVQNEQLSQKVLELQIEIEKLKSKTSEFNSETVSASKYMNELSAAEKKIDELENRVGELSIAVEKGHVATEQLEIFRDQLRVKSKESTEFALLLQSMDLKVKDKEQIKVANKELSRELAEYKVKIDKVPGLLAEIARLRGSSRASVKALSEQDKYLLECKQRIKELGIHHIHN